MRRERARKYSPRVGIFHRHPVIVSHHPVVEVFRCHPVAGVRLYGWRLPWKLRTRVKALLRAAGATGEVGSYGAWAEVRDGEAVPLARALLRLVTEWLEDDDAGAAA